MNDNHPIVIIGSGLAGYNVAREFRKLNTESELIIIADDAADFYSKPMLSNALVLISGHLSAFYRCRRFL